MPNKPLNFKQELTAAFGQPISENPTQVMIEAAYRNHGLDWRYLTIEVSPNGLRDAVQGARAMGFAGFNCTIPHKVEVIKHLDGLGESARLMQAVNCVVRRGGLLIGENTDGKGFVKALRAIRDPNEKLPSALPSRRKVFCVMPCTIRSFAVAAGITPARVMRSLRTTGAFADINSNLTEDQLKAIAADLDVELHLQKTESPSRSSMEKKDGEGSTTDLPIAPFLTGTSAVIFGAGGAARAISVEMALAGCSHITIVNRCPKRGEELMELLRGPVAARTFGGLRSDFVPWDRIYSIPKNTDIVVNATSIGLYPDVDARLDIDVFTLLPTMLVADVIPNPPRTNLIKDAMRAGCEVIDGLGMLVNQGVIGVEYWTGISPDPIVMRAALEEVFD